MTETLCALRAHSAQSCHESPSVNTAESGGWERVPVTVCLGLPQQAKGQASLGVAGRTSGCSRMFDVRAHVRASGRHTNAGDILAMPHELARCAVLLCAWCAPCLSLSLSLCTPITHQQVCSCSWTLLSYNAERLCHAARLCCLCRCHIGKMLGARPSMVTVELCQLYVGRLVNCQPGTVERRAAEWVKAFRLSYAGWQAVQGTTSPQGEPFHPSSRCMSLLLARRAHKTQRRGIVRCGAGE